MLIKHIFTDKIAHSSYMIIGSRSCAVIDPQRDVDIYIEEARRRGVKITMIILTHLHADFVSGHIDLADRSGADIYAPLAAECTFQHKPVSEGDIIKLEDMRLEVIETPGHTPEHVSYTVTDLSRGREPVGIFVGDLLFVGDVGRPDIFPNKAEELAGKLYDSLFNKLLKLPDHCEIYPAHGAGSLCGRSIGAKHLSTLGYEKLYNPALQIKVREEFIRSLTENMPPAPDHFLRCSDINRHGPRLLSSFAPLEELKPQEFKEAIADSEAVVVDIRSYSAYGGMNIGGSYNIELRGNFPTFGGWVLPTDRDIYLVGDNYNETVLAALWLRRVGMDRVKGCLAGGMPPWVMSGLETESVQLISTEKLHALVTGNNPTALIDIRTPLEYNDSHIEGAINIPVPDLRIRYRELDPDLPMILICSTGFRSGLAASILKQHGFKDISHLAGGMTGYSAAGYAKKCDICVNPHGSRFAVTIQ